MLIKLNNFEEKTFYALYFKRYRIEDLESLIVQLRVYFIRERGQTINACVVCVANVPMSQDRGWLTHG